ncbi:MAG: DUF5686 family protein, partial [Bacteroidales bacterium]|nr:DUF5686 family protein [Bacteroidales bacterium]
MKEFKYWITTIILLICASELTAQNTVVTGKITDKKTGESLPYVNITVNKTSSHFTGTMSDDKGEYSIKTSATFDTIIFQFVGYETLKVKVKPRQIQKLNVALVPMVTTLEETKIVAKKEKYHRKNNPAVILIENVIAHKKQNGITSQEYYQYRSHEKTELSLLGVNDSLRNKGAFKKLGFMFDNLQQSEFDDRKYMPIYFMENLYENYYRKSPTCSKTMLIGQKEMSFSKFIEPQTMEFMLNDAFGNVDIYSSSIKILSNELISPLSSYGTRFYQFFLTDTIEYKGDSCIVLAFNPANMRDIGFSGKLWITKDSLYAVKKIFLDFPKKTSINFVKNLSILQEYERINGQLCLVEDKTILDGNFYGANMYGKRENFYSDYTFNQPLAESFYNNNDITTRVEGFNKRSNSWWEENRIDPLTQSEQNTYDIPSNLNS